MTGSLLDVVTPAPDESLLSLVARAAWKNVYERTSHLIGPLGLAAPETAVFNGAAATEHLAALLLLAEREIAGRQHPRLEADRPAILVDWYGTPLPRKFIAAAERRVSPASLRSAPYHRAVWMLRPLAFCPASFERLIASCPHCGGGLGWYAANGPTQCDRCGRTLLRERPGKLDWEYRDDYRSAASLVSPDSTARAEGLKALPAPFCGWEAGEVFEAVVELGHALNPGSRGRGIKSGDFTEFSDEDLLRGYRFVRTWPEGMERIVRNATRTDHGSIEKLFGPLRKYLDPQASQSPLRDLIRSAAPAILRKLEIVPTAPRSGRLLGNFPPDLGDTINARAASELHRVDLKVLRRLERGGQSFVTKGGWREGTTLYRADVLREAVERFHAAARIDECAKLLGVPQFVVPALVEANLLAPETNHDANLLAGGQLIIDRSSVTDLIDAACNTPNPRRGTGTPLSSAMVGRFHPASWVKVLRLLVDGTMPVAGVAGSDNALCDRLLVEGSEVDRALGQAEPSIPAGLRVSCVGAAKLLGVSNVLVNGAFHAGLLPGWQIGRGDVHIEVADVAAFATNFVTPTEGSRLLGLSGVGFYRKMTTLGFQPAGWARKFALWNRSDVQAALALRGQSKSRPARRRRPKGRLQDGKPAATRQAESGSMKQART